MYGPDRKVLRATDVDHCWPVDVSSNIALSIIPAVRAVSLALSGGGVSLPGEVEVKAQQERHSSYGRRPSLVSLRKLSMTLLVPLMHPLLSSIGLLQPYLLQRPRLSKTLALSSRNMLARVKKVICASRITLPGSAMASLARASSALAPLAVAPPALASLAL